MIGAPDTAVIVGAVIALLGGVVVLSYLGHAGDGTYRRHQCQRWEPIAVSDLNVQPFQPVKTAVLKRCVRCGDIVAMALIGQWTLDQVRNVEAEAGAVDEGVTR